MRQILSSLMIVMLLLATISCAGGNKAGTPVTPDPEMTLRASSHGSNSQTYLWGYYDIYFDPATRELEVVNNRTADFTLNIVPFLNHPTMNPFNGITFDNLIIHNEDPAFLGIDVDFEIYHPLPGLPQYNAYDVRGVVISNGANTLDYKGLRVAKHGTDAWMKNPDGYTRWFNPSEFTTTLIFGYAPGGYQNLAGNAKLNPYKYYGKGLGPDADLWSWLTTGPNNDGLFESGLGRTMQIEFPNPPHGLGLKFGYAVVVTWTEQGEIGPYYPVHCSESPAARITQTPNLWYNQTDGSGGKLILDIDLFGWDYQPETIKIESTVLNNIASFNFDTYAAPGGENYSTWHVEAPAGTFTSTNGHEAWIIAEYDE
ncbi:MAG: hypothetical protein NTY09_00310, partial [bacterium]|nr:hypothetical protein [bacterium]